jgi:hypothetical protein
VRYRLILTTDGREGMVERALDSLETHVRPRPQEAVIVDDSGDPAYAEYLRVVCKEQGETYGGRWALALTAKREGFCANVARAWTFAYESVFGDSLPDSPPPWVFWLEDDFVFQRTIPLVDVGYTMELQPQVAQMSFLRQPVSDEEVAAGGFLNTDPERFTRRGSGSVAWIEHRAYWTTNPSLIRREVCELHPWPEGPECEGIFTRQLLDARPDVTFGIWGVGTPWVEHVGVRAGVGY